MLQALTVQELLQQITFYFLKEWLFDESVYQFKKATKTMSGTSMQHLWKYDSRQFIPYCHYYLTGPVGLPLLQNNKSLHRNNHMSWDSLGKTPPAAQIPFPYCHFQAEEAWQLYVVPSTWIRMRYFASKSE